jgi:hypothetical protein
MRYGGCETAAVGWSGECCRHFRGVGCRSKTGRAWGDGVVNSVAIRLQDSPERITFALKWGVDEAACAFRRSGAMACRSETGGAGGVEVFGCDVVQGCGGSACGTGVQDTD